MISALVLTCALGIAGDVAAENPKPSAADLEAYETAKSAAGRDAEAQVKLALWCENHGMAAERTAHLTRAILLDPSNARARGLLGFVEHEGKWLRPEEVTRTVEESPERQAVFQEYLERRTQARDKADDQYKLALWCEENGLTQPMTAHLRRVVELDPKRDGAWRRLGFRKVGKSWINPEAEAAAQAEREAQDKADGLWEPRLRKLKDALSSRERAKRADAAEGLKTIDDPRAVASVWKVFARSNEANQRVAADVLGRIEGSESSRALSMMAVYSPFPDVRSTAAQLLSRRDPREFAGLLAGLIRDEVKYTKKDVGGPGGRGELFIEGKQANVQRFYAPPRPPSSLDLMPGDQVRTDESGMTVVDRPMEGIYTGNTFRPDASFFKPNDLAGQRVTGILQSAGVPMGTTREVAARVADLRPPVVDGTMRGMTSGELQELNRLYMTIPVEQMAREAQITAMVAQRQLAQDVQRIESHNAPIREINDRTTAVLRNVSGADFGADAEKWMAWAVDLQGYAYRSESQTTTPPTIVQEVPLNYQSQVVPTINSELVALQVVRHSCFAAGTMVRTLQGPRPIQEIRPGDQVLSEDTTTGAFTYRAVVTAYHNPPNETYRLNLGEESIVATGIHRFWKAGLGWVMARDVKAGDRLRTIGGTIEVVSVSKDEVQPVFNLQLAGGDNFCVGGLGVIAHDNSFVEPVAEPFDGVPALADLTTARKP